MDQGATCCEKTISSFGGKMSNKSFLTKCSSLLALCAALSGCPLPVVTHNQDSPVPASGGTPKIQTRGLVANCTDIDAGAKLDTANSRGSQLWDFCIYKKEAPITSSMHYFSLEMDVVPGSSPLNNSNDTSTWDRLIGNFDAKATTAAVTIALGDDATLGTAKPIPVFVVTRQTDGKNPSNITVMSGKGLLPYTQFTDVGGRWGISMQYKFGTTDNSKAGSSIIKIAQDVLKYYPVGGLIGTALSKASDSPGQEIDKFVSGLNTNILAPDPISLSKAYQDWGAVDHMTMILYDGSRDVGQRGIVATIVLTPSYLPSLYTNSLVKGKPNYSALMTGGGEFSAKLSPLGGSTSDVFEKNQTDKDLPSQLKTPDLSTFRKACAEGPRIFSASDINLYSQDDAIFATWLALKNSGVWASNTTADCNDLFNDDLRKVGLSPFPAQITNKASGNANRASEIATTQKNTTEVKKALQTNSDDLTSHFSDVVFFRQSVPALPGIRTSELKAVASTEIVKLLAQANAKFLAQNGRTYHENGLQSSAVSVKLELNKKPYKAEIQWDGLTSSSKISGLFISSN
ncbi:hypothetical protein [Sapientia aquatica]|uniref:Uncharacterized protein n=1 Tax=Sapientia aquatica TaxID=1549640 RepID=A0A4R5VTG3_9BURK|nr:hypothetical protein [Sapientia aquatica]TDK61207.1 hypothetical protein E2I14_17615 [Sapientia aquatica]